jgi:CRISPR-associated endonuclease Csy4
MLDFYIDIAILPNAEMSNTIIMNSIFSKLHFALVSYGGNDIGVSFPKFDKTLGEILRLHGSKLSLLNLMSLSWLDNYKDYVEVSEIAAVPLTVQFRCVQRVQVKSNIERLMRRSIKKGWITLEKANENLSNMNDKVSKLPFLNIQSSSTDQKYKLFIKHSCFLDNFQAGEFSTYGLSSISTIPWF